MRDFKCACGQTLYFENTVCTSCKRPLAYDPFRADLLALEPVENLDADSLAMWRDVKSGAEYRRCFNDTEYQVCNWLVTTPQENFCLACNLNDTIPDVDSSYRANRRRRWWGRMEQAKRRLIYTLLALGLPVDGKAEDSSGLAFSFLEDQRSNPMADEEHVLTGHLQGLITVNLAEADAINREQARQDLGESYRTLLGHFRHESGHYYFDKLIFKPAHFKAFRALFGDERADYDEALEQHYAKMAEMKGESDRVSAYADMHPHEDWAECWAHYLHMTDCLETAWQVGLLQERLINPGTTPDIERCLELWSTEVSVAMNALNRSMGVRDSYPFILSPNTLAKLRFVHRRIYPS
tara:strand:- start:2303 stop:3358 length:1056 start_codon:yes stop_codon:yes gene_type:complete